MLDIVLALMREWKTKTKQFIKGLFMQDPVANETIVDSTAEVVTPTAEVVTSEVPLDEAAPLEETVASEAVEPVLSPYDEATALHNQRFGTFENHVSHLNELNKVSRSISDISVKYVMDGMEAELAHAKLALSDADACIKAHLNAMIAKL